MPRLQRVYRAVAHYEDGDVTRHFLTKKSRDAWAAQRLAGYPPRDGYYNHLTGFDDGKAGIPPALGVDIADSEPVIFT